MEHPIGSRVRIQANKHLGSTRLLHGLLGSVIGTHPIAPGWVKVKLDANAVTSHRVWSVPVDRLIPEKEAA